MLLRLLLKLLKGAWRQNPKVTTVVAIGLVATTYFIVAFSITDRDNITDTEEQSYRCLPVSATYLEDLLNSSNRRLINGWEVRSEDYENVYFLSAQMFGGGLSGQIGTWATNGYEWSASRIYAVDDFATEYSDWGVDSPIKDKFHFMDDGYMESRECVEKDPNKS